LRIASSFSFDFNGEYTGGNCICTNKTIYNLSIHEGVDKIPITFDDFADIETLSILFEATEKTQKPFLNRALNYYRHVKSDDAQFISYFRNILKQMIRNVLCMTNKDIAFRVFDYLLEIFQYFVDESQIDNFWADIKFHETNKYFYYSNHGEPYQCNFSEHEDFIAQTTIYTSVEQITNEKFENLSPLNQFFLFVIIKLIQDLSQYKVQLDHVLPVINRFKAKRHDIEKIFEIKDAADIWCHNNVIILNLHSVNLDMRKTIPLLLAKHIYNAHKDKQNKSSLSIIIDEAHNILSKDSFRKTEDWKDYRLETFEEIIKDGRKFGVFVTISSQRPNDISETIISQAHNYFIHQLLNEHDLRTIGNAVSYIDKVTEESIPTLPVGTCIFSGIATPMPLKIRIDELSDNQKPNSLPCNLEKSDIKNKLI